MLIPGTELQADSWLGKGRRGQKICHHDSENIKWHLQLKGENCTDKILKTTFKGKSFIYIIGRIAVRKCTIIFKNEKKGYEQDSFNYSFINPFNSTETCWACIWARPFQVLGMCAENRSLPFPQEHDILGRTTDTTQGTRPMDTSIVICYKGNKM